MYPFLKRMKKVTFYISTWMLIAFIVFIVISSSIPESVIQLPPKTKEFVHLIFPEGWSFFTRSPREEMADIYLIEKNKNIKKLSSPCSAFGNLCGVSRKSRKIGMELSIIASKINDTLWLKQDIPFENIGSLPITKISDDAENKYLTKGEYIIKAELPIPWAWTKSKSTKPKVRIIRIKII